MKINTFLQITNYICKINYIIYKIYKKIYKKYNIFIKNAKNDSSFYT
jgi:hypothetical protein